MTPSSQSSSSFRDIIVIIATASTTIVGTIAIVIIIIIIIIIIINDRQRTPFELGCRSRMLGWLRWQQVPGYRRLRLLIGLRDFENSHDVDDDYDDDDGGKWWRRRCRLHPHLGSSSCASRCWTRLPDSRQFPASLFFPKRSCAGESRLSSRDRYRSRRTCLCHAWMERNGGRKSGSSGRSTCWDIRNKMKFSPSS